MASFDEAKLTSTLRGSFSTYNPTSGANKNADSTPTALVYKLSDGTTLAATVTVTNITTGIYRFSVGVTTANGFAAGEYYELWVTAAVSGDTTVTQSAPIINFKATTNDVDVLATPTNITAGTITTVTNLTNAPTSGDLTATMKASVHTEVLNSLSVDTFPELSGVPAATSTLKDKLSWIFMWSRNKSTETSSERKLYADDTTTIVSTEGVSDNGTIFTKNEAS